MKRERRAREATAIEVRRIVLKALAEQEQAKRTLSDAVAILEHDLAPPALLDCVEALRAIASAPDGTPGKNLKGVARAALARVKLDDLEKGRAA